MKEERLLESIGQVEEKFIEEAAPKGYSSDGKTEETVKKSGRITKVYPYLKWGALAACLCIMVGLGMKMILFSVSKNDSSAEFADQLKPSMDGSAMMNSDTSETENKEESFYNTGSATGRFGVEDKSSTDTEASTESMPEDSGFPDLGLTLSVENVTSAGLTMVVTQNGGKPTGELMTGEPYRLITLVDGTWKTVEELPLPEGVDARCWTGLAYIIEQNSFREFDINWAWIYGELPAGTYRLIKEFMDFRETGDFDTYEYWVEFIIE